MSDDRKLRQRLATAALAAAWITYVVYGWITAGGLRQKFAEMEFRHCFAPGLVEAAASIHARGCPRAFGPHHDAAPYVFHRLNEMLYPVPYYTPMLPEHLTPGDVYVLLPGEEPPVASDVLSAAGLFRVMEVTP